MALTKVSHSMIEGGNYHVSDYGAVGDGSTDDSTSIQNALNALKSNGGVLIFGNGLTYKCNSALELEATSGGDAGLRWSIQGNNSELDFSSLTSGDAFTVGADAQSNFQETGTIHIENLKMLGAEPGATMTGTPASSTVGFLIQYAHNVSINNFQAKRFHTAIKTGFVFPLTATACNVNNNYVGLHMQNSSNLHQWINLAAKECRYSVVIADDGLFGGGRIDTNTFYGLWTEGSQVGIEMDTGDGSSIPRIRNIQFINGFYGAVYDEFRLATTYDFASYSTRGADRSAQIYGIKIDGGRPKSSGLSASSALIYCGNGTCEADFDIPYLSDTNALVGTPKAGQILFRDQVDFGRDWDRFIYDNSGSIIRKINNHNGTEVTISSGVISVGTDFHLVDTEGDASTDDLDTINDGFIGMTLLLKAANDARTVVIKDSTGNIKTNGDFSLTHTDDTIALIYDGTNWLEISRSDNAS